MNFSTLFSSRLRDVFVLRDLFSNAIIQKTCVELIELCGGVWICMGWISSRQIACVLAKLVMWVRCIINTNCPPHSFYVFFFHFEHLLRRRLFDIFNNFIVPWGYDQVVDWCELGIYTDRTVPFYFLFVFRGLNEVIRRKYNQPNSNTEAQAHIHKHTIYTSTHPVNNRR